MSKFFAAVILLAVAACTNVRPVKTVTLGVNGGGASHTYSGELKASANGDLSFLVAGTVKKVYFKMGDEVKSGDLVAELDTAPMEQELQKAQTDLENAKKGKTDTRPAKAVKGRKAKKAPAVKVGKTPEECQTEVDRLKNAIEQAKLYAQTSGQVIKDYQREGQKVSAGNPVLALMGSGAAVEVTVPVNELAQIKAGDTVQVTLAGYENKTLRGTVAETSSPKGEGPMAPVRVNLEKLDQLPATGTVAEVSFNLRGAQGEALQLPHQAILNDKYVFVVIKDRFNHHRLAKHQVTLDTGRMEDGMIPVINGVNGGDEVVTAGVKYLHDGQRVEPESGS